MKKIIFPLFLISTFFVIQNVFAGQSVSTNVNARPTGYWNDTGININKGAKVTIKYISGQWRSNPHWGPTDGKGDARYSARDSYLRPGYAEGSLIGKVGGNNQDGGSSTFYIGNLGTVPQNLEGILWLTVNDEKKGFGDNNGTLTFEITVE